MHITIYAWYSRLSAFKVVMDKDACRQKHIDRQMYSPKTVPLWLFNSVAQKCYIGEPNIAAVHTATHNNSYRITTLKSACAIHLLYFQGTITLPPGIVPGPNAVLMKNEQGQLVLVQPGSLPAQPQHSASTVPISTSSAPQKVQYVRVSTSTFV